MDEQTVEQVIDTWNSNNRIHKYLPDAIAPAALADVSASKGRTVCEQFAHIHNIRLMWLKSAAPDLLEGTEKIEQEQTNDKPLLLHALDLSGLTITELLRRGIENCRIKGFKPHPLAFLGHLISHEAYHRAEIGIILTQAGHPLGKKVSYGLWEWGVR